MPGQIDGKFYQVFSTGSLSERLLIMARDRIYSHFLELCQPTEKSAILDVGVSDVLEFGANALERKYPYQDRLTAVGLGEAIEFQKTFPKVRYERITAGEPLPFKDGEFDIGTSNAVLEHVGSVENQQAFVKEICRVSRRVYVTVPHRFFPVEHHTALPFAHWNDGSFRLACRLSGKDDWARKENLILMSKNRLRNVIPANVNATIGTIGLPLGPFSSNLYFYAG